MTGGVRGDTRKRLAEACRCSFLDHAHSPTAHGVDYLTALTAANDAAREAHEAARSYAVATEAAYDATRSALAVAIAALHEEPRA